jgi:hypothetical protein
MPYTIKIVRNKPYIFSIFFLTILKCTPLLLAIVEKPSTDESATDVVGNIIVGFFF